MAFKNLASLVAKLEVQSAQWHAELEKANRKLDKFSRDAKRSLGAMDVATAKLGAAMRGLAGAVAAAFSAGAIGRGIATAAKFGDEIQKAATRAGIAAGAMSKFAAVGKQLDISLDTLSKSFRAIQISLSRASTGSESEIRVFRALGLEVQKLRALKPDQQLLAIVDQLRKFKDPADAARVGAEVFGKAWAEIVPLIAEGADGIRELIAQQERMGNVFDDDQLRRMADVDDAIKRLDSSWTRFWRTLTAKVSPALSTILDMLSRAGKGQQWGLMQASAMLAADIKDARSFGDTARVEKLTAERNEIERMLVAFSKGPSSRGGGGGGGGSAGVDINAISAGGSASKQYGAGKLDQIRRTMQESSDILDEMIAEGAARWDNMTVSLNTRAEELLKDFKLETFDIEGQLEHLSQSGQKAFDEMSVYADQAARNMQDAFADFLFDPFEDGLKGMLKGFLNVVRRMVAETAAAKIFGSKSSGGFGLGDALSTGIKSLLGFANGGSFNVGGSGGTDSQVVAFRATPGERVSVQTPGQVGMGGLTVAPVYHIDARGASMDVMKTLPVALRQTSDMTVERVRDLVRRGKL